MGGSSLDLDVMTTDLQRHDRWLLCSDGLTKHVTDDEIRLALAAEDGSRAVCERLIDLTLKRGAEDNVTVIASRARVVPTP